MSCNNLSVSTTLANVTLASGGEIHGHIESQTPQTIIYSNTGYYGPDARIGIWQDNKQVAVIEVQQNFCFMEAGDITVKHIAGKNISCKKITGSYANGTGGQVIIEKID